MPQLLRSLLASWLHVLAGRATRLEETLVMRAQAAVAFDDSGRPTRGGRATPGQAEDGRALDGRTLDGARNSHTATERGPDDGPDDGPGRGTGDGPGIDDDEFAGPPPRHWLAQVRGNPPAHWPGTESPAPAPAEPSVDPAGAVAPRRRSGWDRPRKAWAELTRRAKGALDGWQRAGDAEGKPTLPASPTEVRRPEADPTADAARTDPPAADRAETPQTRDSHRPSQGRPADSALPNVPAADSDQKPAHPPVEPPPDADGPSAQAKWTPSPWDRRAGGRAHVDVPTQRKPADPPHPHHDQPRHDAPPHDRPPHDPPPHDRRPPTHPRAPGWFWIPTGPDPRVPTDDANPPATDPWPALPDDEPLWIPPDTAFSDSDQLRRLDDEQRGS
ncbi:hypothetical protein [Actinopolymorpha pittospori]|uniref:Uncharacterized protein n=1 Tax=Actinopolymorpha pittospori TaxID=648752 RepID=A0A927MQT6_9ACTN|nr:hypothetical protein [Actinopolymorpha pittospori]MBE1604522.1 hypothetical protein [Actinopolymorpha pittospori]